VQDEFGEVEPVEDPVDVQPVRDGVQVEVRRHDIDVEGRRDPVQVYPLQDQLGEVDLVQHQVEKPGDRAAEPLLSRAIARRRAASPRVRRPRGMSSARNPTRGAAD
jgi:hypothetical protein